MRHKVVVDNGSTDQTREIAIAAGCEILDFHWNGHFPKKRNWVLQTYNFKTPWVFFLDADERVNEAFKNELLDVLPKTTHDCFRVTFDNWFMGRMLRHGDPMRKTAILRVGKGGYERIEEDNWSNLPMELHEHIHGLWSPDLHRVTVEWRENGFPYIIAPRGMLEP